MRRAKGVVRMVLILAVFLLFSLIFFARAELTALAEQPAARGQFCYTSIKIGREDCLEGIAARYNCGSFSTDEEYIAAVRKVNNMRGDRLSPGCYLTVIRSK